MARTERVAVRTETRVHIRWMIRRDLAEVVGIERLSFPHPWSESDFLACLRARNCIGMVATDRDDTILGFMIYELHAERLAVLNFAVHPEWRRVGIGSQMVEKLIGKLGGHRRGLLTIRVAESNLTGQLFFRSKNFWAEGVDRGWFEDSGEDAYRMAYRTGDELP